MKSNTWLIAFAVVSVLFLGGAGFYCFSSSQKYTESKDSWDRRIRTIKALERKDLYPNEANVEQVSTIVEEYDKSVDDLYGSLRQFQKPLDTDMPNTAFQDLVKNKVREFRDFASGAEFEIEIADGDSLFQMGFDAYASTLPSNDIVPILDYELKAIYYLLENLVNSGAESMSFFYRDLIPGEVGGPEKQEISVVHKYPVRLGFRTTHSAFQKFMNKISNDKEYFYIIRVLKVQNEQPEGPLKADLSGDSSVPIYENAEGDQADSAKLFEWGYGTLSDAEVEANAKAAGYSASGKDARVLMGQEKLDVFMVVDIVRFIDPSGTKEEEQ